jgi:hypothetical protein
MPLVVKDRVKQFSATAGTGTLTLDSTPNGFQPFSVIGNGNTTYYGIVDATTGDWEVGIGTYTLSGTTLSRDSVLDSSSGGSLVNFASNSKDVFCNFPAVLAGWSDYRLKTNVQPTGNPFVRLGALAPVDWDWVDGSGPSRGFLAHEMQQPYPQAVFGRKDGENQYGRPVHQIVDLSPVVADLTKAVMLLRQELDALKKNGSNVVDRH